MKKILLVGIFTAVLLTPSLARAQVSPEQREAILAQIQVLLVMMSNLQAQIIELKAAQEEETTEEVEPPQEEEEKSDLGYGIQQKIDNWIEESVNEREYYDSSTGDLTTDYSIRNYDDLSSLFDQYMIFQPSFNINVVTELSDGNSQEIGYFLDYWDTWKTQFMSQDELEEYEESQQEPEPDYEGEFLALEEEITDILEEDHYFAVNNRNVDGKLARYLKLSEILNVSPKFNITPSRMQSNSHLDALRDLWNSYLASK